MALVNKEKFIMSVVARGAKNAFRNWLRTGAVVVILAIGIGLSLSMLVAKQAVETRINDLKQQVGTTLTVNPAGSRGFEGGGEPLTNDTLAAIKSLDHVKSADATVGFMVQNQDATAGGNFMFKGRGGDGGTAGKTSLQSSIDAGTLGRRFAGGTTNADGTAAPIALPIRGIGTNTNVDERGAALKITQGRGVTAQDTLSAVVGKDLAAKNSLTLGSTFTAYEKTFTVVGIFDQGTKFENDMFAIPLAQAQTLSGQANQVGTITVTVDSIENMQAATDAIKNKLGSDKVDVSSAQQNVQQAISSLQSVQNVTVIGFIAALLAAAVITLLIMTVIVRERRREIGVLKAIGGSNGTIVGQFIVEALVLVAMGAVVGLGIALVSSNGIANSLVQSNTGSSQQPPQVGGGPRAIRFDGESIKNTSNLVGSVTASVGPMTILWGALATLAIAIVGSAVPAWFIAKVRPAEVMRGE